MAPANWRNKTYFYNLFTKITVVVALTILLLSGFLYFNFKSYSLELLNNANARLLEQVLENGYQIHQNMSTYARSLYSHPDALRLMTGEGDSVVEILNNLRSLDQSVTIIPYIESVYIYNGKLDMFYTLGSNVISRKSAEFYDTDIVQLLVGQYSKPVYEFIPRKIPVSELYPEHTINGYSYLVKNSSLGGDYAIIINIEMNAMFNTLFSFEKESALRGTQLALVDKDGLVIAHSNEEQFLGNISDSPLIWDIMGSGQANGYMLGDFNGESSIVTYASIGEPGWTCISFTPYSNMASTVGKVKFILLTIGIAMFLICLVATFLLSRHLYSPVRRLRMTLREYTKGEAHSGAGDEFTFISNHMQTTMRQLQSLESFKQSHWHRLKQDMLKDLLIRSVPYRSLYSNENFNRIVDPRGSIVVLVIKIDNFAGFCLKYNESDRSLMKFALMNTAEELLNGGACVDLGDDQIAALVNCEEHQQEELLRRCSEIQRMYDQLFSISSSVFISNVSSSIMEVGLLYQEALALSSYRFHRGHACILRAVEWNGDMYREFELNEILLRKLAEAIRQGKPGGMMQVYSEIAALLMGSTYTGVLYMLSIICVTIFQTLSELERQSTVTFELDYIRFDSRIKSLETLEQVNAEFSALFRMIADRINDRKSERTHVLVQNVEKYIRLHYPNQALSTTLIADHFQMSTSYLGKLFREYYGKSIAEMINSVRLEKAMELLESSQLTVDEIIAEIGWENKKYFFTIFKKNAGATPTEYRVKSKIDSIES